MLLCKILRCKAVIGKFLLFSSLKIFLNFVSYLLGFLFNLNVCGIYAALKFLTVQCYALSYLALLCFKFPRIRHVFIVVKVTLKWPSVWYISGMNQGKMKRASRGGKLFQCHFVHQKFTSGPESNLFLSVTDEWNWLFLYEKIKSYLIENRAFPH